MQRVTFAPVRQSKRQYNHLHVFRSLCIIQYSSSNQTIIITAMYGPGFTLHEMFILHMAHTGDKRNWSPSIAEAHGPVVCTHTPVFGLTNRQNYCFCSLAGIKSQFIWFTPWHWENMLHMLVISKRIIDLRSLSENSGVAAGKYPPGLAVYT